MKIFRILLIASFILTGAGCAKKTVQATSGPQTGGEAAGIRVLCYNIHHANPPSKPDVIDIAAIANVIKQQEPHLVALQEVDVRTERSGKTLHQAEELARLTGMRAQFFKAIDYGGGEYGVAILSKYPMDQVSNHPLPTAEGTNGERRTLGTAVITLPDGKKFLFAVTHLDAQRNDTNRVLQQTKIAALLKAQTLPVVLAGDMNAVAGTGSMNIHDCYFTRSCITGCPFTIPVINPNKTIDYISYAPAEKFTVLQHKVIPETYASDHLPVFAVLQLK
jgi:endonuclease/exonuclease/phosphatase family metal-dependent hydrolase